MKIHTIIGSTAMISSFIGVICGTGIASILGLTGLDMLWIQVPLAIIFCIVSIYLETKEYNKR